MVSSPFKALEEEVEDNKRRYKKFFELRGYDEIDEILRAAEKIPENPEKGVSRKRLEGRKGDNLSRRYEPWADNGILEEYNIVLCPQSQVIFYSLNENYQDIIENSKPIFTPNLQAQVEESSSRD